MCGIGGGWRVLVAFAWSGLDVPALRGGMAPSIVDAWAVCVRKDTAESSASGATEGRGRTPLTQEWHPVQASGTGWATRDYGVNAPEVLGR